MQREIDLYLRATIIRPLEHVYLLFVYETKNFLRNFLVKFDLKIKSSFKVKGIVEKLNYDRFLVSTNLFSQTKRINLNSLVMQKLYILSNSIKIDNYPVSNMQLKNQFLESNNLLYFTVKRVNGKMSFSYQNSNPKLNQTEQKVVYYHSSELEHLENDNTNLYYD